MPRISTTWRWGMTSVARGRAAAARAPIAASAAIGSPANRRLARSTGQLECTLQLLRMRQMRLERRLHVHQELLELGVGGRGDQDRLERVDHGLVIRHLTVDIGLVEGLALERLDRDRKS